MGKDVVKRSLTKKDFESEAVVFESFVLSDTVVEAHEFFVLTDASLFEKIYNKINISTHSFRKKNKK